MSKLADNLTRYLREDGHKIWGFVVYRASYKNDEDWDKVIDLIKAHARDWLSYTGAPELYDNLDITVIQDQADEDATTSLVREKFQQWCIEAPHREQGTTPGLALRYRFCIYIDNECIESIKYNNSLPSLQKELDRNRGFVKLINKDWEPYEPESDEEDEEIALEGCSLEDVGWMRVDYIEVLTLMLPYLRDEDSWNTEYRRPPRIANCG